jgi:protein required for attachment to host cells
MPHQRLLYVVADGAAARLLERREDGEFVILRELDGRSRLAAVRELQRDEHAGRSMESATTARHAVGREDGYGRAKAAFARETAAAAKELIAGDSWSGVVLAAPSRLLRVLREELEGRANVIHAVAKDLTKTPEHELGRWLDPPEERAR